MNTKNNFTLKIAHTFIGLGLFYIHIFHTSTVFENGTNFSHLSTIEREMLFTSEHALYYSYFKTIAEAPNFSSGLSQLIYNNVTEYPNTINVLKKFHIFPEVAIGFTYKQFINLMNYLGLKTVFCWTVERGNNLDSIISCEGLGDPLHFYLEAVWYIGGLAIFLLYMYATYLSRNIFGGLSAVAYYMTIHNDATRIHRIPAARDNFAFPFILWQMLYLTMCIEKQHNLYSDNTFKFTRKSLTMIIKLTILSTLANLTWQFSIFIFATQTIIMFILLQLDMIKIEFFRDYAFSHFFSNMISYFVMFENHLYFHSFHHPILIGMVIFLSKSKHFRLYDEKDIQISIFRRLLNDYVLSFIGIIYLVDDIVRRFETDGLNTNFLYIDIVLAKLRLKPASFNTLLYMCRSEMAFIDFDTLKTYNKIFVGKFIGVFIVIYLSKWLQSRREIKENKSDKIERSKNYLIEDFLEENKVSMKDLVNPDIDKKINTCLEFLKVCDYDYDKYKKQKKKNVKSKDVERLAFLNDVKKFKDEINVKEKGEHIFSESLLCDIHVFDESTEDKSKTSELKTEPESNETTQCEDKFDKSTNERFVQPFYLYNILQTICFVIMTGLVLKLKYILTPFMCLMASSFPPKNWFPKTHHYYWIVYLFLVLCSIADTGVQNLRNQYHQSKEYSDHQLGNLIQWINVNTEKNAVFAGPSSLITTVMLTTNRPIVNHPRNEFYNMRERTKLVYSILSKQQHSEIYNQLVKLKVQYVILPYEECFSQKRFCKISDVWDYVEPENRDNVQLCAELFQKTNPNFLKVFLNEKYAILKLFSQSIQLELKKINLKELNM